MTTAILTRPKPAMDSCAAVYENAGLNVFQAPCFDIQTNLSVQAEWLNATADVWLVLSIHALHHALLIEPNLKPPTSTRVLAVGSAVADAWQRHFQQVIECHKGMNSEGLIELLEKYQPTSVKILTTGESRPLIKSFCMANQISYSQINTYQRIPLALDQTGMLDLYANAGHKSVVFTATSCGILTQVMTQLSTELKAAVLSQPLLVGAKRIGELAEALGFTDIHVSESPSDEAMSGVIKERYF